MPQLVGPVRMALGGGLVGPVAAEDATTGADVVQRAQQEISSFNPSLWPLVIGCVFVLIVFLLPDGVLSITRRVGDLVRRRQA